MGEKVKKGSYYFLTFAILCLSVFQAIRVQQGYGAKYIRSIYKYRSVSAVDRSAIYGQGVEFAAYIDFLRSVIPENAKVILPPREPVQPLANIGYVQYFLMPRSIQNCGITEVEACILRMTGLTSYIVTAWKFPPEELALQVKKFVPFPGGEGGVYVPK